MFWKKSPPAQTPSHSEAPRIRSIPSSDGELDRALDTIGAIMRSFGQHAFDTDRMSAEDVRKECETLTRSLLLGPTKPESRFEEGASNPAPARRRDWGSVHRYVDSQRRNENTYVRASLSSLREAVQSFARCLTVAVASDKRGDVRIETQLHRLEASLQSDDATAIRREADGVVQVVRDTMEHRRAREQEQLVQLGRRVETLRGELDAARERATLDGLTRLYNRAAFDEELEKVAALGLLLGPEPVLVMVDVDHFKSINDRYGHPAGDTALKYVADQLVRHFMRKVDFVARYGGEEFAVVVRDSTLERVVARANTAREALGAEALKVGDELIELTVSMGAAALDPGEPEDSWVARADRALYAAKRNGRNRLELWTEGEPAAEPER
jgi:diguanylate cyclase